MVADQPVERIGSGFPYVMWHEPPIGHRCEGGFRRTKHAIEKWKYRIAEGFPQAPAPYAAGAERPDGATGRETCQRHRRSRRVQQRRTRPNEKNHVGELQ